MLAAPLKLPLDDVLDQGKSIGLSVVIQQVEQRRQGQALSLGRVPVGHGLGGGVHIGDCTVYIGGNHPVAN